MNAIIGRFWNGCKLSWACPMLMVGQVVFLLLVMSPFGCKGESGANPGNTGAKFHNVWKSSGKMPREYLSAGLGILYALDQEGCPLTPGNVLKALGSPSSLSIVGHAFDASGSTVSDMTRLLFHYEDRRVIVRFAVLGTVDAVLLDLGPRGASGESLFVWPRPIREADVPVLGGIPLDVREMNKLRALASEFADRGRTEGYWYARIVMAPEQSPPKEYNHPCTSQILTVDVVSADLARVLHRIVGEHVLYYDSWWLRDRAGTWGLVSDEEAMSRFSKKQ